MIFVIATFIVIATATNINSNNSMSYVFCLYPILKVGNPFIFFKAATIQYAEYKEETGNSAGDKPQLRKVIQFNIGF